jgi:hypothetical protein
MKLRLVCAVSITAIVAGLLLAASPNPGSAQKLRESITIQAQAMGQSTQMGKTFNLTAHINEWSSPEDQKNLLEAFKSKGNEGLVNALEKMSSKGRLAITGTLGGDLAYCVKITQPDGSTVIRLVTNRALRFGEAWGDTRSSDYQLSALEIAVSKDGKKKEGTLLPATQLKADKEGHLEIEAFQNPWKLVNIQKR